MPPPRLLLALAACIPIACTKFLHSLPEDPYAFPKYKVAFLNNLPIQNETAERWLHEGLLGGEPEFLEADWTWTADTASTGSRKEIGGGSDAEPEKLSPGYTLEAMKIGPRNSYLCLIPNPLDLPETPADEDLDAEVAPAHSWSLLQPLTGSCLYHRQGWFTYSYCHNQEIRQFKELMKAHVNTHGGYKPEEDKDWESFTLGRAPATSDLAVATPGAGSRYLVQRWGDGTMCDRTGRSREVEVQFHCSMAMSDTILFVKETKTCSYILVINTPRLCGEPGFRSRQEIREQATISCREIISSNDASPPLELRAVPNMDYPQKIPIRAPKKLPPSPPKKQQEQKAPLKKAADVLSETVQKMFFGTEDENVVIKKFDEESLQKLLDAAGVQVDVQADGDQFVFALEEDTQGNFDPAGESRLREVLLAAGYDLLVEGEDDGSTTEGGEKEAGKDQSSGVEGMERPGNNREVHEEDEDIYYDEL